MSARLFFLSLSLPLSLLSLRCLTRRTKQNTRNRKRQTTTLRRNSKKKDGNEEKMKTFPYPPLARGRIFSFFPLNKSRTLSSSSSFQFFSAMLTPTFGGLSMLVASNCEQRARRERGESSCSYRIEVSPVLSARTLASAPEGSLLP